MWEWTILQLKHKHENLTVTYSSGSQGTSVVPLWFFIHLSYTTYICPWCWNDDGTQVPVACTPASGETAALNICVWQQSSVGLWNEMKLNETLVYSFLHHSLLLTGQHQAWLFARVWLLMPLRSNAEHSWDKSSYTIWRLIPFDIKLKCLVMLSKCA